LRGRAEGTRTRSSVDGSQLTLTAVADAFRPHDRLRDAGEKPDWFKPDRNRTPICLRRPSSSPCLAACIPARLLDYVDVGELNGLDFQVWKDPRFADPARRPARRQRPGAAAVVDYR
jgi:hypothetical protein